MCGRGGEAKPEHWRCFSQSSLPWPSLHLLPQWKDDNTNLETNRTLVHRVDAVLGLEGGHDNTTSLQCNRHRHSYGSFVFVCDTLLRVGEQEGGTTANFLSSWGSMSTNTALRRCQRSESFPSPNSPVSRHLVVRQNAMFQVVALLASAANVD